MRIAGWWLWLLVPSLGIIELVAQVLVSERAPELADYSKLAGAVAALKGPKDVVLIAPAWAEPLSRSALGEELLPLADVARPDLRKYARVVQVSSLGQSSAELRGFRLLKREKLEPFVLEVFENPEYRPTVYDFVESFSRRAVRVETVEEGNRTPCRFSRRMPVSTGGLHGHLAYPRQRFRCAGSGPFFVGVTVIDDENYRPRRCIWAEPPVAGERVITYQNVPLGKTLRLYGGFSYFLMRDDKSPVEVDVRVNDESIGHSEFRGEQGWASAEYVTGAASTKADVQFRVRGARSRPFCFYAYTL